MKLIISRNYGNVSTTGKLVVFDGDSMPFVGVSIELPWLNNQRNHSCVPEGNYHCIKTVSPKHGDVFLLSDVPNRSMIEIHIGNYAPKDTLGCILPGMCFEDINKDGNIDVAMSTIAMQKLYKILPKEFDLIIIS